MEEEVKKEEVFDDIIKYNKRGWIRMLLNIIFWLILIFLIACAALAFTNFRNIDAGEEPYWYYDVDSYVSEEQEEINSYNYFVFKVVEKTIENKRTVNLTLEFFED